jgi:hypothetical protein
MEVVDVRMGSRQSTQDSCPSDLARGGGAGSSQRSIPIYEQDVEGEPRFIYYGETDARPLLAVVVSERGRQIRVVTAYDLDAQQKRDYLARRVQGE